MPKKPNQKAKRPSSNMPDLLPHRKIEGDHFVLRDGTHKDIYKIKTFDLDSFSSSDTEYMIALWARFYQSYGSDVKIVAMNCATDTHSQQSYFKHKRSLNHNPLYDSILEEKYSELQYIAQNNLDRLYYLVTFSDDENKYLEDYYILKTRLLDTGLIEPLTLYEKLDVEHRLANKILPATSETYYTLNVDQLEQEKATKSKGFNPYLLADIQPAGGINFNVSRYMRTGSGYETCITIYKYPSKVGLYWLIPILGINRSIVTLDINTQDPAITKQNLNDSIKENQGRLTSTNVLTDADSAAQRIADYRVLYDEIERQGQVNKQITTRIFLYAATYQEIDEITGSVIERLQSGSSGAHRAAVYLNESKADWSSQYQSYTQQSKLIYSRVGQPVLSYTLAKGLPFYFTNIADPNGSYYGDTNSNQGTALLDIFSKSSTRLSYNGVCFGTMGSGKSSLLKKTLEDQVARGNYLRIIDPTGEYENAVAYYGGHSISIDGSNGILNALEILHTADTESMCWVNHVSKLSTCYKIIAPSADDKEINEFETQLIYFYSSFGLIDQNQDLNYQTLTNLPSTSYPTWSDFRNYIQNLLLTIKAPKDAVQRERTLLQVHRLDSILLHINSLIDNYGYLVDGHTSISHALDAQVITFNTSGLSKVKSEIFDMQLFLTMQLAWDNCVQVGGRMKDLYDKGQIEWNDITRFMIVIDESHRFLNAQKLPIVQQAITIQREARKYFGGLWLASQSIRDYVPEGSTAAAIDQIKLLFELSEYKFLMRQDSNSTELLRRVFSSILSENDIDAIPKLEVGNAILCIGSERKIQMHITLSDRQLKLFTGGA